MRQRPLIDVACGVLVDAAGAVLIAQRPPGKLAAGKWEFPGGKIEAGEQPRQALLRELDEELGIAVIDARPLLRFRHDYSDRCVILDTWRVDGWRGQPRAREAQAFAWHKPDALPALDLLPTVAPIVRALQLPAHYVFTPPAASVDFLLDRLATLPRRALLRLRLPVLDDTAYEAAARRLLAPCGSLGIGLMLDRRPEQAVALGAAGWHLRSDRLDACEPRPLPKSCLVAASVHDARQLERAAALGAHCAVLGPVRETATHPGTAGIGWASFAAIRGDTALAVYAIGGLDAAALDTARAHGAQGIAAISAYWS